MVYQELTARVGVVPGGTNLGIVRIDDSHVFMIDSGLNDSVAKKALRAITDELGSTLVGVLNTHAHADHFGANAWVKKRTGAEIVAPRTEAAVIECPILQPAFLYGGADPMDALRGRFLNAEPCRVDTIIDRDSTTAFGVEIEVVPLPGHSINQLGYMIDGVFFAADVGFPLTALEKYKIPYIFGLTEVLSSLETAENTTCTHFVAGHGPILESAKEFVDLNRQAIEDTIAAILDATTEPITHDQVCSAVFRSFEIPPLNEQGYYLLRPTIAAYLAHLERTGQVEHLIENQMALWRRVA